MCRHSLKLIPKRLCSYCTKLDVYWRRKCGFLERTLTLESDGLEVESSRLILGKLHSLSEPQFSHMYAGKKNNGQSLIFIPDTLPGTFTYLILSSYNCLMEMT